MGNLDFFTCALSLFWVGFQSFCLIPGYLVLNWSVLLPLRIMSLPLYDKIESTLFSWCLYLVGGWVFCGRTHLFEYGANISKDIETTGKKPKILLICNHQSTADVPSIMFSIATHPEYNTMWVIASEFRYTNFGIVSWTHGDFFIKERSHVRGSIIKHCRKPRMKNRNCFILFPEGGFRYKRMDSSDRYAAKNGLPALERVIWPRTGAFEELTHEKMELTHIVDLTIIFSNHVDPPSMFDLCMWTEQKSVYLVYKIFEILPDHESQDASETLGKTYSQNLRKVQQKNLGPEWLRSVWLEKEELIETFYSDPEKFFNTYGNGRRVKIHYPKLIFIRTFNFIILVITSVISLGFLAYFPFYDSSKLET